MLKKDKLIKHLEEGLTPLFKDSLNAAYLATNSKKSEALKEAAELFSDTFTEIFVSNFAMLLGTLIDTYIKSANIHGYIVTTGTATSQQVKIDSSVPLTNGAIPNTFGIK